MCKKHVEKHLMQFADTVIDQLWEVWRISQVDKCDKVCSVDPGMGGPRPLHTLTSLECELWPLQVLRQILEVHLYPCNSETSPFIEKMTYGKKHINGSFSFVSFLFSFWKRKEHYTLSIKLKLAFSIYMENPINVTWHLFVNILLFFYFSKWSPLYSVWTPSSYKVEQIV